MRRSCTFSELYTVNWGKYDPAIQYIKRSLQLNPANAEACFALGITMQQKGLTDEALDYFQQSVNLDPNNAEARKILGNAFKEKANAFKKKDCSTRRLPVIKEQSVPIRIPWMPIFCFIILGCLFRQRDYSMRR